MNINEFTALAAEGVLQCLREEGDDQVRIQTTQLMKMNDQSLHGLTFQKGEEPAPTYYLDEMFTAYTSGVGTEELFSDLAHAYRDNLANGPMPTEIPDLEYRNIRRKVGVRLLGMDYNRQFLKTVPYREVGHGYALICEVHIGSSDGGLFSTIVTNDMAEEYRYNMDELFDAALETAWKTHAASFDPVSRLLDSADEQETCFVLSTNRQMYGAAALFYPGTQDMIAHVLNEGYYAIPSSLHEFIIMRESQVPDPERLRQMVIEANRVIVRPEDVLSDNLLYYSKITGELSQVLPAEACMDFAG